MRSLLWTRAPQPIAVLVLAHGAGAPMDSEFMEALARALAEQGVSVARFEFPYMQQRREDGRKRPPSPARHLLADFQSVVDSLATTDLPVWVAGKSMGGRMATLLAEYRPVVGVVAFGYPFHPPGKPQQTRIAHLPGLEVPCLIVQGERDPFGKPHEVAAYGLPGKVAVHWLASGDHDFKPLKRSGLKQTDLIREAAETAARFIAESGRR